MNRDHATSGTQEDPQLLADVRACLEASEREMIRRWSGPRAATLLCWCVLALAVLAGVSYTIADHLLPRQWSGSMVLEVNQAEGDPVLPPEMYRSLLLGEEAVGQVMAQFQAAGVGLVEDEPHLRGKLAERLRVQQEGQHLELFYRSNDPEAVEPMLTALGQVLTDAHVIAQRGMTIRVAEPPERTPEPTVSDRRRLQLAGLFFGATLGVMLGGWVALRRRLQRMPSVLEEEDSPWPASLPTKPD